MRIHEAQIVEQALFEIVFLPQPFFQCLSSAGGSANQMRGNSRISPSPSPNFSSGYNPRTGSMPSIIARISRRSLNIRGWQRQFATMKPSGEDTGQNLTEKIVQRYAVGLPQGKIVRSGDYVSIKPEHCMSHDNCITPCNGNANVAWPVAMKSSLHSCD